MPLDQPQDWQRLLDLLRRELGSACERLLAEGTAPAALVELVDERREALRSAMADAAETGPGLMGGSDCEVVDYGKHGSDDSIEFGRVAE
jgi:hypothetical protein